MAFMKQVRYITPLCVKTSFVIPFFIDVNIKKNTDVQENRFGSFF